MSTYYFKTNINSMNSAIRIKDQLDKLEQSKEIDHWKVHVHSPDHLLEVVTDKMSPEQVKHVIRASGFEADFTRAPQSE